MNILCMGGRTGGPEVAWDLVKTYLGATYSDAFRHLRRLGKVAEAEAGASGTRSPSSRPPAAAGDSFARERVYRFGPPTIMERLILPGAEPGPEIWVKREDLSAVKSYKWRGACNRMAVLSAEEAARVW